MTQDKTDFSTLIEAVSERQKHVKAYLMSRVPQFLHPHLQAAVTSYIEAGGKSLRPGVLMFSCGAVGGDERLAIPAAAAVELYHTWTLVHDDIIDRDERRRGSPTVHAQFRDLARTRLLIKPLGIASLAGRKIRFHIDLVEGAGARACVLASRKALCHCLARAVAVAAIGRDKGRDHDLA